MKLAFRAGYQYQTVAEYTHQLATIRPEVDIDTPWIALTPDGLLTIKSGYAWDGATGATDIPQIMRASCTHDALYGLIRMGYLPRSARDAADRELERICLEDGMPAPSAAIVYQMVRWLGDTETDPASERPVLYAPDESVVVVAEREAP